MKKVTYFGLLLAVALTGLSSCSSSDDVTSDPTNTKSGESRLTLTISTPVAKTSSAKGNSFAMGSRATDINSDPGATAEQQINRITVGIFSPDGKAVRTIQELSPVSGNAGPGTYTQTGATATATIVTNSLENGDSILVACNAPAGTFKGVQNATDFKAKTEDIDSSLAKPFDGQLGKTLVYNNIPMFGKKTLSKNLKDDNFSASVDVCHQTAKVTLDGLSVDFKDNGPYRDASFTPKNIYLLNVPAALNFSDSAYANPTKEFYVGLDPKNEKTGKVKEYLTSSEIKNDSKEDITLSGYTGKEGATTSLNKVYTFYTMPNNDSTKINRTKLIIYGTFKANQGDSGSDVYYPVPLNISYDIDGVEKKEVPDGTKHRGTVNRNKNYKCNVVIRSKGASSPDEDITPKQATITVKVQDFEDASQDTYFN